MNNTSKIALKEVNVINGRIKSFDEYEKNIYEMAKHIYEAHEYAARSLGFSCGAEMDDYIKRANEY